MAARDADGHSVFGSPWRIMFLIGAVPAFLAFLIMRRLKEPERWERASHEARWPRNSVPTARCFESRCCGGTLSWGCFLGCAGVIGLWSVGFYTFDLIRFVQRQPVTNRVYHDNATRPGSKGDRTRARASRALLIEPNPAPAKPAAGAGRSPRPN